MGNGSSTAAQGTGEGTTETLRLSKDMQESVAADFEKEQIVRLFGKQVEKIGERKAKRMSDTMETRSQLHTQIEAFRKQNKATHSQLDQQIEQMEDRLADSITAATFDAERLETKYADKMNAQAKHPCHSEHTGLAACLRRSQKAPWPNSECDTFVSALDKCVTTVIASSS